MRRECLKQAQRGSTQPHDLIDLGPHLLFEWDRSQRSFGKCPVAPLWHRRHRSLEVLEACEAMGNTGYVIGA